MQRTMFETSRLMEYFSEKELSMQIGFPLPAWAIALLKELIDNGIDSCENEKRHPGITVDIGPDHVTVQDNGPGLSPDVIKRSLDYSLRVSDKSLYISPTRGQLGNALKCVWAAPFVATGQGGVEIHTPHGRHYITVNVDPIASTPEVTHTFTERSNVKTGTKLTLHWPEVARYLTDPELTGFCAAKDLVDLYSRFNPHVAWRLCQMGEAPYDISPTNTDWGKWTPDRPTSPHWYTPDELARLLAGYLRADRQSGIPRSVREFIADFAGLSSTGMQKQVTDNAGLTGATLEDLAGPDGIRPDLAHSLHGEMVNVSKVILPKTLGILGKKHFLEAVGAYDGVDIDSVRYKKLDGLIDDRLPFIVEAAMGWREASELSRSLHIGLNWSPALRNPIITDIEDILDDNFIDGFDPVVLMLHLVYPRMGFEDRSKSRLTLPEELQDCVEEAIRTVAKDWKRIKKKADNERRVRWKQFETERQRRQRARLNVKQAAWLVMEQAYLKASAGGTLPANARQIMYAARPLIISLTGKSKPWAASSTFTGRHLPDFMAEHPELTQHWDVVYDDRGHFIEPHTGRMIGIGTLNVRRYIGGWLGTVSSSVEHLGVTRRANTSGPVNRFGAVLFIEKEGFMPLMEQAGIAQRYDLGIMSTKGMRVTAAARLVEELSKAGVTIYVARDFDKSGFSIIETLRSDTRRYAFENPPDVVDLGLSLEDAQSMGLDSEEVVYEKQRVDPRDNLRKNGATEEECNFLVQARLNENTWRGARFELNAMDSQQFLDWLTGKLEEHGVKKVVPKENDLQKAYARAVQGCHLQRRIDEMMTDFRKGTDEVVMPPGFRKELRHRLEGSEQPWDEVLWEMVKEKLGNGRETDDGLKGEHHDE